MVVKVGMPINGRDILGPDENYFGTFIFYMYFSFLMADLESFSINDLAEQVYNKRKTYMIETYIKSAFAYMHYNTRDSNTMIYRIFNLFSKYDLAFTNWSRFTMYKIDSGHGPPKCVFLPTGKRRNGMITILPTNNGNNEIELYIRLEKRFVNEFLNMLN